MKSSYNMMLASPPTEALEEPSYSSYYEAISPSASLISLAFFLRGRRTVSRKPSIHTLLICCGSSEVALYSPQSSTHVRFATA
ncbi:hypothetical protein N7460_007715 [Penicillium canescens]|uniref:Uncharacterized protein n=1 Tax=Penicillium canescens TaxID=5083 RepID=A0AAD6I9H4_PENCN|nr:hypothetical protein N7460_007715 [Penicillium canescens]